MRPTLSIVTIAAAVALAACSGGEPKDPIVASELAGDWSGAWNNLTFESTGDASMTIVLDEAAGTAATTLDLDGPVFGGGDPDAIEFTGTYDEGSMNATPTLPVLGDFTLEISAKGVVTGTSNPDASEEVADLAFDGTIGATDFDCTYTITTSGGDVFAEGTLIMTHD